MDVSSLDGNASIATMYLDPYAFQDLGSYNPDGTQVINDNIMWTATAKATWQMTRTAQLAYFHNLPYKLIGHRGGGTFADGT